MQKFQIGKEAFDTFLEYQGDRTIFQDIAAKYNLKLREVYDLVNLYRKRVVEPKPTLEEEDLFVFFKSNDRDYYNYEKAPTKEEKIIDVVADKHTKEKDRIDFIIEEYLDSAEIYPDKFIFKFFSTNPIQAFYNQVKKYGNVSDENLKKVLAFLKERDRRIEVFLSRIEILSIEMADKKLNPLDIQLITHMDIATINKWILKSETTKRFGKRWCTNLSTYLKIMAEDHRIETLEEALSINYVYHGRTMNSIDIQMIIDYLDENGVSITKNNIIYAFEKLVDGKIKVSKKEATI